MSRPVPQLGHIVRRLRRAVHERTATPGREPVDIAAIIAPLRYDVVVRARFFDFLAEHRDLSGAALVDAAGDTAYAAWFEHVECARYFPDLAADAAGRQQRFAARVAGAARLLASFEEHGFAPGNPVTLIAAPAGSVSDSGAPAMAGLHIGDGCHRLALLLRSGATLEPWMYKVRRSLNPLVDNTVLLLRAGVIDERDYVAYLGRQFPIGTARTVTAAVTEAAVVDPAAAEILRTVIAAQAAPPRA